MKGSKKAAAPPDTKQKTLFDFFKGQSQKVAPVVKVRCPGCDLEIPQSRINWHLDQDCKSKAKNKKAKDVNLTKRKKILKSVKDEIAKKKKHKVMLSDDESDDEACDSFKDEVVVIEGEEEDVPFFPSSMLETKLFEFDGEVTCKSSESSPSKLGEESLSSPAKVMGETSPYFSPNSKNPPISPPKQNRSEKLVDFQVPSTSQSSSLAMLELDWSSPQCTPVKMEGVGAVSVSSSHTSIPEENKSNNNIMEMLKNDWNSTSPLKTPNKSFALRNDLNDNSKNSDSESDDFDNRSVEYRTPRKVSRRSFKKSPNSNKKLKDINENVNTKKEVKNYINVDSNEPGGKLTSNNNSNANLEEKSCRIQGNPLRDTDEKVKMSTGTETNKENFTHKKHLGAASIESDNDSFCTPSQSPILVSPSLTSISNTSGDSLPLKTEDESSDAFHVRKLFPVPIDPSPPSSQVHLSPSIKNNLNKFSKVDSSSFIDSNALDSSSNSSQSQENSRQLNSSQERAPRLSVRTPYNINKSLKTSALLENSPQKTSRSIFSRKRSQSSSPEKPFSLSQSSMEVKPFRENYDKAMFRGHKGYYLENFLMILDTVLSEPSELNLFNEEDLSAINTFRNLSLQAQKLYVRLFQRKVKWNKVSKIEYRDICDQEDTELYVNELSYASFLLTESELSDLGEVLQLMSAEDLKGMCSYLKISATGTKDNMTKTIIKHTKQQPTLVSAFFKGASNNCVVLKRAKEIMGRCCLVNKIVKQVFMRVLMLYGLPRYDEDDDKGQSTQLTTLLMVNLGKMNFPKYELKRQHAIFQSREELIRFEGCSQILADVQECIENQKWEEALNYCDLAKLTYETLISNEDLMEHEASLPRFLRRFTSISLLIYVLTCSVECYQRLKDYRKAVKQLEFLLDQKTHLQDYRGRWYDRLALNLDQHLKSPRAVDVIREALHDPEVRKGHCLALSIRAERLAASKFKKRAEEILAFPLLRPMEPPKIIIEGRCLNGDSGYKRVFIRQDSDRHAGEGAVTVCSVEELAMGYYKSQGFTEGLHREGTTVNSLFGVFFWDALYTPIPDVFRSPHQAAPLDLDDLHFYQARKQMIDQRLLQLQSWSESEAETEMEKIWNEHHGRVCLVAWDVFRNLDYMKGLVVSMKLPALASICKRLAEDHRFTRSGFPDLVVWDPINKRCRIVEVKGPNDRLSTKQILWLDYLVEHGIEAEVCHVEAIGAKKMKLASPRKISPKKRSPLKKPKKNDDDNEDAISDQGVKRQRKRQSKSPAKADKKRKTRQDYNGEESNKKRKPIPRGTKVKVVEKMTNTKKQKATENDDFVVPPPRKSKPKK